MTIKRMSLGFAAILLAIQPAMAQQSPPATSADIAAQTRTLHNDAYAYSRDIIAALKAGDAAAAAKLDTLHADLLAMMAGLKAGTVAAPAANSGTSTAPAATVNAFPANPADAPFPSPENSRSVRVGGAVNGTIGGAPYLVDDTGSVYQLVPIVDRPASDPQGVFYSMGITRNGKLMRRFDDPTYNYDTAAGVMLLRSGKVYVSILGGQWTKFTDGMGSFYNADLPDIATAPTGTPATPAAITLPARYAVPPGSTGRIVKAAPGQIAAVWPTLKDGDELQLSGSYHEAFPIVSVSLRIRLMDAATVLDFDNLALAYGKGGIVCLKDCEVTGPGLITNAGIREISAGGTAGFRNNGAIYMKASGGVRFEHNQNGIAGGDGGGVVELDDVVLRNNGLGDGYTHNIYVFGGATLFTANKLVSEDANVGHPVKTRALKTVITNSVLTGSKAGAHPDDSSVLDVPDGGQVEITNTTITKLAGSLNHLLIGLGMESGKNGATSLVMTGGALVGLCDSPLITGRGGSTMTFNNVANSNGVKVQGATATGL